MWFSLGFLALLSIGACSRGTSAADTARPLAPGDGAISGTVRGPEGAATVEGRTVEAVNVETGERLRSLTDNAGGFTFKLKPGRYRVQLALRAGEALVKQPGVIDVDRSEVDSDANFVVGSVRVSRPRPSYRIDDGLGPPVA